MTARLILILALIVQAPIAVAQSLDGTWILFDDAGDPELTRLAAAGATLPREQLEQTRRVDFAGTTATVYAAGATVTFTLAPKPAAWGFDAQVLTKQGTDAPINVLRVEFAEPNRATLTTFFDQVQLERFAMLRVRATQ